MLFYPVCISPTRTLTWTHSAVSFITTLFDSVSPSLLLFSALCFYFLFFPSPQAPVARAGQYRRRAKRGAASSALSDQPAEGRQRSDHCWNGSRGHLPGQLRADPACRAGREPQRKRKALTNSVLLWGKKNIYFIKLDHRQETIPKIV